jgi:hypothetical protein
MHLVVSFAWKKKSYFLDLRIKSYGCLKFQGEVWAGRACAGANQQELTTCAKSGGQGEKKFKKNGYSPTGWGVNPRSPARPPRVDASAYRAVPSFLKFFYLKKRIFGSSGNGPVLLGEWVYSTPIFWRMPLHLEVLIRQKFMESGDLTFFQKTFLLNLVHTWTFLSTVGIFVSW